MLIYCLLFIFTHFLCSGLTAVQRPQNNRSGTGRSDNEVLEFKCKVCGTRFKHRGSLTRHLLNHTGKRRLKCEVQKLRKESIQSNKTNIRYPLDPDVAREMIPVYERLTDPH